MYRRSGNVEPESPVRATVITTILEIPMTKLASEISGKFEIHSLDSAPANSIPALERLQKSVGGIPHLAGAMAESPSLIDGFVTLRGIFQAGTFTPAEREIIMLGNAVENGCNYCRAIHSAFALKSDVPASTVAALRASGSPDDPKLKALSDFARLLLRNRGRVDASELERFLAAGYNKAQALELILGLAVSVLANYSGRMIHPPLDPFLQPQA
jgi:AhpD family alkylhydroperoxidase